MRRRRGLAAALLLLPLLVATAGGEAASPASAEECGHRPFFDSISISQIVGGHDAQIGMWPWSVSLQHRQAWAHFVHVCGGVLINKDSVLTAAHCITGRKRPYTWRAVLGTHNLLKLGKQAARRRVRSITVHPHFEREVFENDIALIELVSPVRYSSYIQPICLPPADFHPDNQTKCFISGWGHTEEKGNTSAMLKEAQVEIIPSSTCNSSEAYRGSVNNNMICAGSQSGGTDTCQGDSGGPLACSDPSTGKYYLLGIASFGVGCGREKFPGIYVRVSQYSSWIKYELLLRNKAVNPGSTTLLILLTAIPVVLVGTFRRGELLRHHHRALVCLLQL